MTLEMNPNQGPSADLEQNPHNINPRFAEAFQEREDGQIYLDENVLSQIEQDTVIRLTAEKIVEIDKFLTDPNTPEALKKIFEKVKSAHAKQIGGIEEITYH